MNLPLDLYDLPDAYVRKYQPVRVSSRDKGLRAYVFDRNGLWFFRQSVTAEQVPSDAVWSIVAEGPSAVLRAGEHPEASGFLVSQQSLAPFAPTDYPLPRRLTYRQRVRQSVIKSVIDDLAGAPCPVPAALLDFLRLRLAADT